MAQNRSVALGDHFEQFIKTIISEGRYKNANEAIRAGLRLLEEQENRVKVLRYAVQEGLDSGIAADFEPENFLQELKARK